MKTGLLGFRDLTSICQVSVVGQTAFMVAAERALESEREELKTPSELLE